jgi:CubicO group peptidase (beta-lactamase class C family)
VGVQADVHLIQSNSLDIYGQPIPPQPADGIYGDKNIYSTVQDLLIWDRALKSHKLLSDSTLHLMFTGDSHEQNPIKNYGLGWRIYNYPDGHKIVYHCGFWEGNSSVFYRFLNDDYTVIILSNRYNPAVFNIWPFFDLLHLKEKKLNNDDWLSLQ